MRAKIARLLFTMYRIAGVLTGPFGFPVQRAMSLLHIEEKSYSPHFASISAREQGILARHHQQAAISARPPAAGRARCAMKRRCALDGIRDVSSPGQCRRNTLTQ